jgi:hypothetical protein
METILFSHRGFSFLLVSLCAGMGLGFAQTTFEKTYGGPNGNYGSSVRQTSDGGFILTGYTDSSGTGRSDVYFVKTTFSGDTLWTRTVGRPTYCSYGNAIQQTCDGGFVIAGTTVPPRAYYLSSIYLIKTNASGDTLWTTTYSGGGESNSGRSVQQTTDGGYIIVSPNTSNAQRGDCQAYLVKTDSTGDRLWQRWYGGDHSRWWASGYSVQQTSDGGYILAGYISSDPNFHTFDVYLVKTDSSGDTLWTKTYNGKNGDVAHSVQQTTDGGFIVAGYTNVDLPPPLPNKADVYLLKTNALGDTLWTRTYGGPADDYGFEVLQTSDGGYIIVGSTTSFGAGSSDVYLLKTNSSGDTLWTRTFGGTLSDAGYSVQETSDGGYIIAGSSASFSADSSSKVYLIKTNSDGLVTSVDNDRPILPAGFALQQNYPNPFNPLTIIKYTIAGTGGSGLGARNTRLVVYDVLGREVAVLVNERKLPGNYEVTFDGSVLSSGIYICRLKAGPYVHSMKMLLVK